MNRRLAYANPAITEIETEIRTRLASGNVWREFLGHIRDSLYRRQYREERAHPEFVDHGGES